MPTAVKRCTVGAVVQLQLAELARNLIINWVHDRLNGWNSTLQAVWYIIHVRWTCLFYVSFIIPARFLWTKPTIWLSILSFTTNRSRVFYVLSLLYRSVTPLDAASVNRTIFHNHSVHWYYITLIDGRDYMKYDIITTCSTAVSYTHLTLPTIYSV